MVIDGSNPSEKNGDPTKKDWFDSRCLTIFYAQVMELVDIPDLESGALRREGSSPSLSTIGI